MSRLPAAPVPPAEGPLLDALLACADQAVVVVDAAGRLVRANAAAGRLLGVALAPGEDARGALATSPLARALGGERVEGARWPASGAPVEGSALPLAGGGALVLARAARETGEGVLRRLGEAGMLGLMFCDDTGRVLDANEAFLELVGRTREELEAGRVRWDGLTAPEHRASTGRALEQLQTRGVALPYEKAYVRPDGTRVDVVVGSVRLHDAPPGRNVTFVIDLSGRHRVEAAARFLARAGDLLGGPLDLPQRLQSVAELSVPELADWSVVRMRQPDGSIRTVAAAHADPEKLAPALEFEQRYPIDPQHPVGTARVMRTGEPELAVSVEPPALEALGRDAYHRERLAALQMGSWLIVPMATPSGVLGAITWVRDRGKPPYTQDDLTLAGELARRAALSVENARLYQEAREAVQLRDEFISVASHELKTPITSLGLRLEALQRTPEQAGPGALEAARRQVRKLDGLVGQLLDVSRIRAGRLTLALEDVDLAEVAREVAGRFEADALKARSTLALALGDAPVVGTWDRTRLEQVVTNLVSNALKYGRGRPVRVALEADAREARLSVTDEGIGIGAADLPRLFGRFERAVSERNYGGLGLGLYITRQIVEAMGGEVGVQSAEGAGSTFWVRLPR